MKKKKPTNYEIHFKEIKKKKLINDAFVSTKEALMIIYDHICFLNTQIPLFTLYIFFFLVFFVLLFDKLYDCCSIIDGNIRS